MKAKHKITLTKRQIEELAKFSLDLSKLTLGAWVLGLFTITVGIPQILLAITGLLFSVLFFIIGIRLFKEIK